MRCRVQALGFRAPAFGVKGLCMGFRAELAFRVEGLGFRF